ncbi:hypothetical protein [Ornithinimicrobium pekingense]|uniref:Uncharacterized protein n=1 Tax=Ornithinimicrobium pekingense TaxID=384677 RepID=A0ABQ2FBE2_9MICO|nr:hypothetical protein [Ornithinimicrobium pekingense]GGK80402.1 hypothetical protein GCM10011509_31140 [Ornithinimicrobium pekingense]
MSIRSREAGQTTLEYLGVVIAGVVIVLGLMLTPAGPAVKDAMDEAVCAVTTKGAEFGGGGACTAGGSPGEEGEDSEDGPDYEPDSCTVSTASTTRKVEVSIAIVDLGGESGVSIAEIRHSDGTVEYHVTNDRKGEGGVGVGIGGKGKGGEDAPGAAAEADLGIKGSYTDGNTYRVDSLDEARELQQQLIDNPWADVGSPHSETVTWGGEFNGSVDLGLGTGGQQGGGSGSGSGQGSDGEELGGGFSLDGSHSYATTTNYETGETTYVTSWTGSLAGNADAAEGLNYAGDWSGTTSMAIVRDANGQITRIELVTQTKSGSTLTVGGQDVSVAGKPGVDVVTTTSLPVTDGNRAVVEQWLGSTDNYAGFTPLSTMFWNPTQANSDPMQNLVFTEAQISQVGMLTGENSYEVGGEVKWGIKLGASYHYTDATGEVVSAEYAGEPAGGSRPWINMEVCFP